MYAIAIAVIGRLIPIRVSSPPPPLGYTEGFIYTFDNQN